MAQRFEWAHATSGFRLVGPDELAEYDADEGNPDREYGVWLGDEVMVYGDLDALHSLAVGIGLAVEAARKGPIIESPSGWSYRESQENGDQVDCHGCGNPLDDDLPIVNDGDGFAYHEGHIPN